MNLDTPVAFIVYNRPNHTEMTFERIRSQRPRQLFLIADGPNPERRDDDVRCRMVRKIIEDVDWPCEVHRDLAESNLGLKRRVVSGLDWVFSQVDRAIVLEDDCLAHPDFFSFCDQVLERYESDPRVGTITGDNFQGGNTIGDASYYFSKYFLLLLQVLPLLGMGRLAQHLGTLRPRNELLAGLEELRRVATDVSRRNRAVLLGEDLRNCGPSLAIHSATALESPHSDPSAVHLLPATGMGKNLWLQSQNTTSWEGEVFTDMLLADVRFRQIQDVLATFVFTTARSAAPADSTSGTLTTPREFAGSWSLLATDQRHCRRTSHFELAGRRGRPDFVNGGS